MKRCRKCNRRYDDDTLRFCLEDGSPLFDARDSDAPATEILPARGMPTLKSSGPTIPSYSAGAEVVPVRDARADKDSGRHSNPILTVGVVAIAVLLLALVGIAAVFVLKQGDDTPADPGRTASPSTKAPSPVDTRLEANTNPSPAPPNQNSPLKITASASSIRLAVQANTYYASNAMDGKRVTAWIEGADGAGLGEWIQFDFDREIVLHRILWQPGYFKSPQIWAENNRLAAVTAHFSDGSSRELSFSDRMESQKSDVGSIRTKWVRFVVKSVYYGSDPDTALSEVAFEWDQ